RAVDLADAEQLAAVRNESFGGDWNARTYRDEVMRKPGYRACREIVAVAPDGRAAAFAVTWFDEVNRVGHFEPVGTSHRFRRLGLARALLLHGLGEMRRAGMRTATVQHDASNRAAAELYANLGFEKRYETYGFRRVE
ncbi:MAG: GNAT family N-acetyltransferase, partial [Actinophytocola sp.]|nr:GNAT family N-acetyltransferase [Actinophytocola sp.]